MRRQADLKHNASRYVFIVREKCRGCWKCLDVCRQGVIGRINLLFHKHALIVSPDLCRGCCLCVKVCSFQAIVSISCNTEVVK
jgi:NAD-dependent dihydropyrimidine dehydrogenase PreA subunit